MRVIPLLGLLTMACSAGLEPALSVRSCEFIKELDPTLNISCGELLVPEDWEDPRDSIIIRFAVVHSQTQTSKPPVIYLNGGPGGPSLETINFWAASGLNEVRDLILVDHRGVGYSSPLPDVGEGVFKLLADDLTPSQEMEGMVRLMDWFHQYCDSLALNTSVYNSFSVAKDIGALMNLLPYDDYHLLGISYGTKLGQLLMDAERNRIRSAVMYGPVSVNTDFFSEIIDNYMQAFETFEIECLADPTCRKQLESPGKDFTNAVSSVIQRPIELTLWEKPFILNAQDVVYFARYLLYQSDPLSEFPKFVRGILARDRKILEDICAFPASMITIGNTSAYITMMSYDDFSDRSHGDYSGQLKRVPWMQPGLAFFNPLVSLFDQWQPNRATWSEKDLQLIVTPTLILVHAHDPASPPSNLEKYQSFFMNARTIEYPEFGHIRLSAERIDTIKTFLKSWDK